MMHCINPTYMKDVTKNTNTHSCVNLLFTPGGTQEWCSIHHRRPRTPSSRLKRGTPPRANCSRPSGLSRVMWVAESSCGQEQTPSTKARWNPYQSCPPGAVLGAMMLHTTTCAAKKRPKSLKRSRKQSGYLGGCEGSPINFCGGMLLLVPVL
eukprot:915334-Alexandrium_andersonii.AAC.1